MWVIVIAITTSIATGVLTGVLLAVWLLRRPRVRRRAHLGIPLDPDIDRWIEEEAARWANANERPQAAGLVAEKLRAVLAVARKRSGGRYRP